MQNVARVRPGDSAWPSQAEWDRLRDEVGGYLVKIPAVEVDSKSDVSEPDCERFKNPYFISDQIGLTQASGWVDAWKFTPSVYAVVPRTTEQVVAAVNFAREKNLRLVIQGGGHSYKGASCAPDSLLIWMREMRNITLHDAFVARGCEGKQTRQHAVTVEAGATWLPTYDAVTTKGGRYVQGAGALTVGVAGLIQSGGFGSFSKRYGLAAGGLLEAEIVTADGLVRLTNAAKDPDLFWGIKGCGGGSLGVVTRVTLKTHELPTFFGVVSGEISSTSDIAFRQLISEIISFYRSNLFNAHWGERIVFRPNNTVNIGMLFQGLNQPDAEDVWTPFVKWLAVSAPSLSLDGFTITTMPARRFWDPDYLASIHPSMIVKDNRPNAPATNIIWSADERRAGQFIHGYKSAWLPASLLQPAQQQSLTEALFAATRHGEICLHFNKGLAGTSPAEIAAARDTPMNPAVLDAFALARCSAEDLAAFPGYGLHDPKLSLARRQAAQVSKAMNELLKVAPGSGSYVAESDYFEPSWQESFWGSNYPRLLAIKKKYDPMGLFYVHHGVGSDEWGADGSDECAEPTPK